MQFSGQSKVETALQYRDFRNVIPAKSATNLISKVSNLSTTEAVNQPIPVATTHSSTLGGVQVGCSKTRKALVFSLWDGIFANAMVSLTETFSVAAAVFLKAPPMAIALLGSLPLLLSSAGQLFLPRFLNPAKGRKFYVLRSVAMQSWFLFLIALIGWLPAHLSAWTYVFAFTFYGFSGNLVSGLWMAWMGDLVPTSVRGRHFAWRNRIFSLTQLACTVAAGILLRQYKTENATWMLFTGVFLIAGVFRFLSLQMLKMQHEPENPHTIAESQTFDLSHSKQFLFYCISAALLQGTTALAGPFFNVWYIKDLNFSYLNLSLATCATVLGTILFLPMWGKLADSLGNRKIVIITCFMICLVPIPYVFSSLPWHIWILNFYTGLCWSGYNLSNFNLLLTASRKENPEKRICTAVAFTGVAVFLFSLLGGFLATRVPIIFEWRLQTIFLISSMLRLVVFMVFFLKLPHYEPQPSGNSLDVFNHFPGYRSGMGILRNAFRAFRRM